MTPAASLDDLFGPMDNKLMSMSTEDIPSIVAVEAPTETEVDDDDDGTTTTTGSGISTRRRRRLPNLRTFQTPPRGRNTRGR